MGLLKTSLIILALAILGGLLSLPPASQVVYHIYSNYHPVGKFQKMASFISTMPPVAVNTALQLDIFEHLGTSPRTAEEIGKICKISVRGATTLLDYLVSLDLLSVSRGSYSLLPASRDHLLKSAGENYIGGMIQLQNSENLLRRAISLPEAVKQGKQVLPDSAETLGNEWWELFAKITFEFSLQPARSMAALLKDFVSNKTNVKVLDIASGSGAYGYTVASVYPQAHVTLMDQENVLPETRKWQKHFPTISSSQISFLPGDAFTVEFGGPYDVVLVSHFLHHFDFETNVAWLKRLAKVVKPGGLVVVNEMVRDDGEVSIFTNPFGEYFNLLMMLWTNAGEAYKRSRLQEMLEASGATKITFSKNFPLPNTYVVGQF